MLGWFAETTLVAAGLAVVAVLAGRLRPVGPTVRHALWLVVLIKLMTPPLVSWPWAVPWGELEWPIAAPMAAQALAAVDHDRPWSAPKFPEPTSLERASERVSPILTEADVATLASYEAPVEFTPVDGAVEAPVTSRRAWAWPLTLLELPTLPQWIFSVWLAVSVVLGVGQAIRIVRFRRRLRECAAGPGRPGRGG